jgi:hypothetical protein
MFSQLSHVQQKCSTLDLDKCNTAEWQHRHPYDKNELGYLAQSGAVQFSRQVPTLIAEASADKEKRIESKPLQEWAIHQVEHSLDYAVDSKFWLHISNGLNLQVVHHLFPQVGWGHYRELSVIVQEVCTCFDVTYSTERSFFAAATSHFEYLTRINDEPLASVWVRPPINYATEEVMQCLDQVDMLCDSSGHGSPHIGKVAKARAKQV